MSEDSNEINAAIAGQILSSWLPSGPLRKFIFFAAIIVAICEFIFGNGEWYGFLLIFISCIMSPKFIGGIAYCVGKISRGTR